MTKSMKLYIVASGSTIGSMLAQEDDNGVERAIYYLTRTLVDAETRYNDIEKLCLCLYFSCNKLKQYIKPVDVYVSSHYDVIKHMLSKPILHSRTGKWALVLTEFSLTYVPLKAMKGQIVADFIVEHGLVELSENLVDQPNWKLFLIVYYAIVVRLLEKFEYVEILHVPRSDNYVTNELAQIASGYRVSKRKLEDMVEVKEKETH